MSVSTGFLSHSPPPRRSSPYSIASRNISGQGISVYARYLILSPVLVSYNLKKERGRAQNATGCYSWLLSLIASPTHWWSLSSMWPRRHRSKNSTGMIDRGFGVSTSHRSHNSSLRCMHANPWYVSMAIPASETRWHAVSGSELPTLAPACLCLAPGYAKIADSNPGSYHRSRSKCIPMHYTPAPNPQSPTPNPCCVSWLCDRTKKRNPAK